VLSLGKALSLWEFEQNFTVQEICAAILFARFFTFNPTGRIKARFAFALTLLNFGRETPFFGGVFFFRIFFFFLSPYFSLLFYFGLGTPLLSTLFFGSFLFGGGFVWPFFCCGSIFVPTPLCDRARSFFQPQPSPRFFSPLFHFFFFFRTYNCG